MAEQITQVTPATEAVMAVMAGAVAIITGPRYIVLTPELITKMVPQLLMAAERAKAAAPDGTLTDAQIMEANR